MLHLRNQVLSRLSIYDLKKIFVDMGMEQQWSDPFFDLRDLLLKKMYQKRWAYESGGWRVGMILGAMVAELSWNGVKKYRRGQGVVKESHTVPFLNYWKRQTQGTMTHDIGFLDMLSEYKQNLPRQTSIKYG